MKTIVEYINESLQVNESKNIDVDEVIDGCKKIIKWNNENNIKKLIDSYMSAGDVEDFDKEHWKTCVDVVDKVAEILSDYLKGAMGVISMEELTNVLTSELEDNGYEDSYNDTDPKGDWDIDEIINLFNTVSSKVCKKVWLI